MSKQRSFERHLLPSAAAYLAAHGLLRSGPRSEWVSVTCPAHKAGEERNPSLRVSLIDGHFRCMACGVKGGDVLSLHRLLTGASFVQAATDLGAMR